MEVKVKLINLDDDVFQSGFNSAKVDLLENEGYVKAMDEVPNVIVIDCFKLPNDVLQEVLAQIISAYGISKWMVENDLHIMPDEPPPSDN